MENEFDELDDFVNENEDVNINTEENNVNTQNIINTDYDKDSNNSLGDNSEHEPLDIISELLKSKGIVDRSKIKFENENGDIEEISWDNLDDSDKLNILTSNNPSNESDLDDVEIQLINTIRSSKMSPQEYMSYIQQQGIKNYLQNSQTDLPTYQVDDISDDELFIADLISRVGEDNITDEEVQAALDAAKANEMLFKKQIDAIRNEYKKLEDRNTQQNLEIQQQEKIQAFNKFAESIENEIRSFTDIHGYSLNMDESEMEELYDFITGFDDAGVSIFGKVLNDPKTLVSMAWFALNGEKAIQEISDYWSDQITQVRKNSYNQGIEDYKNGKIGKKSSVTIRTENNNKNNSDFYTDLDEF